MLGQPRFAEGALQKAARRIGLWSIACVGLTAAALPGCKKDPEPMDGVGGEGGMGGADAVSWEKVELDGAVCADGSQYKFFVKRVPDAVGLAVTLEPGGACWDYQTCGGDGAPSRAAHLQGIEDNHMVALPPPLGMVPGGIPWRLMFPHLGDADRSVATVAYDQVYLPYCTGDAFLGDLVATYGSPDGEDELVIHHRGAGNVELIADWLTEQFASPEQLLVLGSSAGGLGASFHYARFRDAVTPLRSSLVNDSGPIFPPGGPQTAARLEFTGRWQTEDLLEALDDRLGASAPQSLAEDSGHITALLAAAFPDDRLLVTHFLSDLDNSVFSYAEQLEDLSVETLGELWQEDTQLLIDVIEETDNWGYFFPGFRPDNCSHTVTLLPVDELEKTSYALAALRGLADGYLRTDLGELDFGDALDSVLAESGALMRERALDPMADFTPDAAAACLAAGE